MLSRARSIRIRLRPGRLRSATSETFATSRLAATILKKILKGPITSAYTRLGSGLSSWNLSQAVSRAGGPKDNLTGFLEFYFTNLSRSIND